MDYIHIQKIFGDDLRVRLDDDDDDELFLRYGWLTKDLQPYFQ